MKFYIKPWPGSWRSALFRRRFRRSRFPTGPSSSSSFGAGGGADIEGRLLAKEMSKVLGVPLTPINKPGGGGAITYTYLTNAEPDGHTIAWNSTSVLTTTNLGNTEFGYDAMDYIGRVEFQPQPFAVKGDSKWNSFADFVTDCKAAPGTLKVANSGTGSSTHAAAIMLMNAAGCEVIHLPKGIKGRNKSVLNGEADAMIRAPDRRGKSDQGRQTETPGHADGRAQSPVPGRADGQGTGVWTRTWTCSAVCLCPKVRPARSRKSWPTPWPRRPGRTHSWVLRKRRDSPSPPRAKRHSRPSWPEEDAKVKAIFKSAGLYKSK